MNIAGISESKASYGAGIASTLAGKSADTVRENPQSGQTDGKSPIADELEQKRNELEMFKQQLESSKQQSKNAKEYYDEYSKVMTIFRRICNGDIVPPKDEHKLMKYSKDLYLAAKTAAMLSKNDTPEKFKSVDKNKPKKPDESDFYKHDESFAEQTASMFENCGAESADSVGQMLDMSI